MSRWERSEVAVVVAAVRSAPARRPQPWTLEFHRDDHGVSLFERVAGGLLQCGAALANLVLSMRVLGWRPEVRLFAGTLAGEVARVTATARSSPSSTELAWCSAIAQLRSHERPFAAMPVERSQRELILGAAAIDGVRVREPSVLAVACSGASWAPDTGRHTECLVMFETAGDGPADRVRAGLAVQRTWLAATRAGLVGSLSGKALPRYANGIPQAVMRFGYPADLFT